MTEEPVIVAWGSRTPLGLRAAPSAAAVRAHMSAVRAHPYFVDLAGDAVPAAFDRALDPTLCGGPRMLQLALPALKECIASAADAGRQRRVALFLALPALRPGFSRDDTDALVGALVRASGDFVTFSSVTTACEGHAGGLSLMASARAALARQTADACVVGGVESYMHPDTIEWLLGHRQLVSSESRSGFVPGEGAAFCVLCPEPTRRSVAPCARLAATAVGSESRLIKTNDVCLGDGLSDVLLRALSQTRSSARLVDSIICDVNGERYRGEEWGFACLRVAEYLTDPTAYLGPADCWGDMGAASGPLFVVLACESAARAYAPGPSVLLWAGSESGLRAAVTLELRLQPERQA